MDHHSGEWPLPHSPFAANDPGHGLGQALPSPPLVSIPPHVHPPPPRGGTVTGWFQKKLQQCHIAQDCIIMRARC